MSQGKWAEKAFKGMLCFNKLSLLIILINSKSIKKLLRENEIQMPIKNFDFSVSCNEYVKLFCKWDFAIFHALRAITALDGFDSTKYSGIIAYVNKEYVKIGIFYKQLSKILDTPFRLREKANYDDFFIISDFSLIMNSLSKLCIGFREINYRY